IRGVQVVWQKGFIGVVAPKEWDAIRASEKLNVTWSNARPPFPKQAELYDHIRKAVPVKREVEVNTGDVDKAFASAARVIEATYEWPFQSHASMAPACGVADVRADGATVWTGTQKAHFAAEGVAAMLGLPAEKVKAVQM